MDECVPRPLGRLLTGCDCRNAIQMRWSGLENGVLLEQVEADGFDVFLTSDQNLGYQQNLAKRTVAIDVLPTNHWPQLKDHAEDILQALATLKPGAFLELTF